MHIQQLKNTVKTTFQHVSVAATTTIKEVQLHAPRHLHCTVYLIMHTVRLIPWPPTTHVEHNYTALVKVTSELAPALA
jgi:hypothetical protein